MKVRERHGTKMRYIWEAFLNPENQDVYVRQADVVSPYYEMAPQAEITDGQVEFNAMYRYEDIFAPILTEECLSPEMEKWYVDIIVHFLVYVDMKSGLSVDEYRRRECINGLREGIFGDELRTISEQLDDDILYQLSVYYVISEKTEATVSLFAKALIKLMGTGVLYQDTDETDTFYYYVGRAENQKDFMIIQLVIKMLLPLGKKVRIFWNHHFGICGQDITMLDDEIVMI